MSELVPIVILSNKRVINQKRKIEGVINRSETMILNDLYRNYFKKRLQLSANYTPFIFTHSILVASKFSIQ